MKRNRKTKAEEAAQAPQAVTADDHDLYQSQVKDDSDGQGAGVVPSTKHPKEQPAATTDNLFADLDRLRISQNFAEAVGVKKLLVTVPVKKPDRQWFVRTHSSSDYRLTVALLELREERDAYLVVPDLAAVLPGDVKVVTLFTAVNRQGSLFLWPVKLPGEGRQDAWSRSALEAATLAQTQWVKVSANMNLGAYDIAVATATLPEPEWPEDDFKAILGIAFKDKIIATSDHPVLRQLRGEV